VGQASSGGSTVDGGQRTADEYGRVAGASGGGGGGSVWGGGSMRPERSLRQWAADQECSPIGGGSAPAGDGRRYLLGPCHGVPHKHRAGAGSPRIVLSSARLLVCSSDLKDLECALGRQSNSSVQWMDRGS
jgi:hypothetical protein